MERSGLPLLNHLLQHTLRTLCGDAQWVYSVFWRILPRNYPPPKWDNEGGPFDRNKGNKRNWILVWEDGYCDFVACRRGVLKESQDTSKDIDEEGEASSTTTSLQPELFFKMSHDVYNYGEGLIGKVAADNSYKWIFRDPSEKDVSILSPWQGSVDSYPRTWEAQFKAGIQTIAIVAVGEGLLQLGSTKKAMEDLNFVIMLQRKFNYLQSIPGVFAHYPVGESKRSARVVDNNEVEGQISEKLNVNLRYPNPTIRKPLFLQESTQQLLLLSGVKRPLEPEHDPSYKSSLPLAAPLNQPPNSAAVVPSMSSLHALLSKLPAVTSSPSFGDGDMDHSVVSIPSKIDPSVGYIPSIRTPSPTPNETESTPLMNKSRVYTAARSGDHNNHARIMGWPAVRVPPAPAVEWPDAHGALSRPQPDTAFTVSDEFETYNSLFGEIIS